MSLNNYFLNLIQKSDGFSPDQIRNAIDTQPNILFHIYSKGFNFSFLSSLTIFDNLEILFSSDDEFSVDEQKNFVEGLLDDERERVVFLSSNYEVSEINSFLTSKPTLVAWRNNHSVVLPPSRIVGWANIIKDQVRLVANGYSEQVIKRCLNSPLKVLIRKGDYEISMVQELVDKGKEKVNIIADNFAQSELDDFKNRGAVILKRGSSETGTNPDQP